MIRHRCRAVVVGAITGLAASLAGGLRGMRGGAASAADAPEAAPSDPELAEALKLNTEVVRLWKAKKFAEAEPLARRSLGIRERRLGPKHPLVAQSLENLGAQLKGLGRLEDALVAYRRAADIRANGDSTSSDLALALENVGGVLLELGRLPEARSTYERAVAAWRRGGPSAERGLSYALKSLVFTLWKSKEFETALPLARERVELLEKPGAGAPLLLASALLDLGAQHFGLGQFGVPRVS